MAYATVGEVAAHLGIGDTYDDAALVGHLAAAENHVTTYCTRTFALDATVSAREYPVTHGTVLTDDFATATGLVVSVDGVVIDNADLLLLPLNGRSNGMAWPYTSIVRRTGSWPCSTSGLVSVTARWGWSTVPESVREATIIEAADLFHGRDARFGVVGLDSGTIARVRINPQAAALLEPFTRPLESVA